MGPGATSAITTLALFSDKAAVDRVPEPPFPNRVIRWDSEPMHLPFGAAFALAKIDPESAREHLDILIKALSFRVPREEILMLLPLKDDLIRYSKANLKPVGSHDFFMGNLALNFLRLDPQFKPGLAVLETQLSSKAEPARRL